jgi:hypothetical protein
VISKVTVNSREVQAALRKAGTGSGKALQAKLKIVSATVASAIAGQVPVLTGKAAASVRPRATQTGASIVAGGPSAPYYPWLDFGGGVGRGKSIKRTIIKEGRYIYPTIIAMEDVIKEAAIEAEVEALTESGFTSVSGG